MKNTKKDLNKFADKYFTVLHINEDGSRGLQYGGLGGLKLIEVLFRAASMGTKVVIIESDKVSDAFIKVYGSTTRNNSQKDPEFYSKFLSYSEHFRLELR